jgi:hypothetical protein
MAFGQHWEWRGFGRIRADLRARIEAFDPLFASDRSLIDAYLWSPNCAVNVKLRLGDLKFKRLLEMDGDLECWLEDEREIHPFPLAADVVEKLGRALAVTLPEKQKTPVERNELAALLQNAQPPAQIFLVEKQRRLFSLPLEGADPAIVELTEIVRPERITTVAVEHVENAVVRRALAVLGLPDRGLRPQNYLQTLSVWATGERISQG